VDVVFESLVHLVVQVLIGNDETSCLCLLVDDTDSDDTGDGDINLAGDLPEIFEQIPPCTCSNEKLSIRVAKAIISIHEEDSIQTRVWRQTSTIPVFPCVMNL